jgi:hypothetical protein
MNKFSFMLRVAGQKTTFSKIDVIAEESKMFYVKGQVVTTIRIAQWKRMRLPRTIMVCVNTKGKKEFILMC